MTKISKIKIKICINNILSCNNPHACGVTLSVITNASRTGSICNASSNGYIKAAGEQ